MSFSAREVFGSLEYHMVKSFEIWHTDWGQSPDSLPHIFCLHPEHSNVTNGSNLEMCLCM